MGCDFIVFKLLGARDGDGVTHGWRHFFLEQVFGLSNQALHCFTSFDLRSAAL